MPVAVGDGCLDNTTIITREMADFWSSQRCHFLEGGSGDGGGGGRAANNMEGKECWWILIYCTSSDIKFPGGKEEKILSHELLEAAVEGHSVGSLKVKCLTRSG